MAASASRATGRRLARQIGLPGIIEGVGHAGGTDKRAIQIEQD